jgi:hypothetical protein
VVATLLLLLLLLLLGPQGCKQSQIDAVCLHQDRCLVKILLLIHEGAEGLLLVVLHC